MCSLLEGHKVFSLTMLPAHGVWHLGTASLMSARLSKLGYYAVTGQLEHGFFSPGFPFHALSALAPFLGLFRGILLLGQTE